MKLLKRTRTCNVGNFMRQSHEGRFPSKMSKVKPAKKKHSIAFCSLYYWTKCLGINPLSLSKNGDLNTTLIGIYYNCLLSLFYCYVFYVITTKRVQIQIMNEEVPIGAIADYLGLLWQFFETFSTWLIFAFFQRRIIVIVKSFKKIERISESLETSCTSKIRSREMFYNFMIFNSVYFVSILISNAAWSYMDSYYLFIWIVFYVPTLASFNATMLYVMGLLVVKRKFRFLNEKLRDLVNNESANHCPNSEGIPRYHYDSLSNKILLISRLHRELRNVIHLMKTHFGVPVLLNIGNNFTYMTLITYAIYQHLKLFETGPMSSNLVFLLAASHWFIRPMVMFLLISNICGSTLYEAFNTGNILHEFLNNCNVHEKSPKYSMQLGVLSLDLLKNPLNISVFGLFKLDHLFFYSMIASSISYSVIMLQFYT